MTRSPSYLAQNQYGYCFRMRVPHDLQSCVGKKELKRSLETGYLPQARSRAMILGGQYKQLFRWVRLQTIMGKMTEQEIQELLDLFVEFLGDADLYGIQGMTADSRRFPPEDLRDNINKAKDAALHYKQAAVSGDYSGGIRVDGVVDELLQYTVKNPPAKGSPEYKVLCRKAAEALRDKWDAYQKYHTERLTGVFNAVNDGVQVAQVELEVDEGPLLSEVIKAYAAEKQHGWTEKSGGEIAADSLGLFKEIVGDVPIQKIDRKMVSKFKHVLVRLPPNRNKTKKYRDKAIPELLEMESEIEKVFAPRTVNKHLSRVGTFFNYAGLHGDYIGNNPATGMEIPLDPDADDKRAPYSINDLTNIFKVDGYANDNFSSSYMFWTPVIALFHGMRQSEIAQLHLSDIKKVKDGTWVFDVNDLEDKKVKNRSSKRLVPIHPFVKDTLNLVGLKQKLEHDGLDRLFPEIKPTRDGYGAPVSKWYNERFKHTVVLEQDSRDRWKDFHSFRKTFITHVAHKDVPDRRSSR